VPGRVLWRGHRFFELLALLQLLTVAFQEVFISLLGFRKLSIETPDAAAAVTPMHSNGSKLRASTRLLVLSESGVVFTLVVDLSTRTQF
jgi:hypothetical protein